ncbi:hypothetical protein N9139_00225 [Akkermansiaceae bacterium]|nr:hypothetical protein [Akkermansiaceae bacterium]
MISNSFKTLALAVVLGFAPMSHVAADDTPLAEQMEVVSKSLKLLRRAETNADKVVLVQKAQVATLKGLEFVPDSFKNIKDKDALAKATADYKRLTGLAYVGLCELEMAFLAGDEDKADDAIDKLKDLKKEGHKAYKSED